MDVCSGTPTVCWLQSNEPKPQTKQTEMNIGKEPLRSKLRMTIIRGGVGQRPNRLSHTHPVAADQTILSGMLMTKVNEGDQSKWVKGVVQDSLPNQFFFAVDDSNDGDVRAAGNLQGLSVRGDYQLGTSQFVEPSQDYVYTEGTLLTPDGNTGLIRPVIEADKDVVVVAVCAKDYLGPIDLSSGFRSGSLLPDGDDNITEGIQGGVFELGRATNADDLRRLTIETVQPYLANRTSDTVEIDPDSHSHD